MRPFFELVLYFKIWKLMFNVSSFGVGKDRVKGEEENLDLRFVVCDVDHLVRKELDLL